MNLWQLVAIPWGAGMIALVLLVLGWKAGDPVTFMLGVLIAGFTVGWFSWLIHLHRSNR